MKTIAEIPKEESEIFYESFLNSIESEKDPRNLMLVFDTINCISKFELSQDYVEELFESIFCYFPITFRSNPSDPNLITVDELKGSLRRAISGDKRFGDLAISLLIDKISSNSLSAKIDSLDVLLDSVNVYDPSAFIQYRYQLEVVIFSEIIANSDTKIQSKALKLVNLLSNHLGEEWMNKFLMEALKAIELESQEIIKKSAVLIESVASSSESCFKFALDRCAVPLIKLSSSSNYESIKGQVARNSLVALFSPLKQNPKWINQINSEIIFNLNNLFSSIDCSIEFYGVYLVIFSFICSCLRESVADEFIEKFLSLTCPSVSNELKNCIWLASKSYPKGFFGLIEKLENYQIISASASTSELAKVCLLRLIQLDRIKEIEKVLMNLEDFSTISNDFDLVLNLLNLPIDSFSIIKLISNCDGNLQSNFIKQKIKLETVLIACRPEVIFDCKQEIEKEIQSFSNPNTITSIFNKCPNIFELNCHHQNPELFLSALKGLIYRMDPTALILLKENIERFPIDFYAKMFKSEDLFNSNTFHTKKALHLQWIMTFLIEQLNGVRDSSVHDISEYESHTNNHANIIDSHDNNKRSSGYLNYLAVLISVVSVSQSSLINLNSNSLTDLILNFLKNEEIIKKIDSQILKSAWEVLLEHFRVDQIDELIKLALKHSSIEIEKFSLIRFFAMKLLSKLIENPLTRSELIRKDFNWQSHVLSVLKSGPLNDPKRAVRQEAARANNLWIIYKEDGVLQ